MLSNVSSNFKLSLLGKELSPVPFAKDLGVFMDSTLSFDEHVMQITSKCIASLCQINRVRLLSTHWFSVDFSTVLRFGAGFP